MTVHHEDAVALDALLDRAVSSANEGPIPPAMAFGGPVPAPRRMQMVERLLSLLGAMPAADPPTDLADRTLRRVEQTIPGDRLRDDWPLPYPSHRPHA